MKNKNDNTNKELFYTNEFLKNLEAVIQKEDGNKLNNNVLKKIKQTLDDILDGGEKKELLNFKTDSNKKFFQNIINEQNDAYNIFWLEEDGQKIICSLIKKTGTE